MKRTILVLMVVGLVVAAVAGKPTTGKKSDCPPKEPAAARLKIVGQTNWGVLTQSGNRLAFNGHGQWDGVGEVRRDGSVAVVWTLKSTGEPCPGVYAPPREKDGALVGKWGYASRGAHIDADGVLQARAGGYLHDDTTHALAKGQPGE